MGLLVQSTEEKLSAGENSLYFIAFGMAIRFLTASSLNLLEEKWYFRETNKHNLSFIKVTSCPRLHPLSQ